MRSWIVFGVLCTLAFACSSGSNETAATPASAPTANAAPTAAPTPAPPADPQTVFATRCATCHGTSGKGDGPAAVALNPKPRDYTNKEWQASVTDEQIKAAITKGGAAVGKSPLMPAHADLEAQAALLDGIVKIIRAFGQ